jgi:hypothetical protein
MPVPTRCAASPPSTADRPAFHRRISIAPGPVKPSAAQCDGNPFDQSIEKGREMKRLTRRTVGRFGIYAGVTLAGVTAVAVSGTPAQAIPPNCQFVNKYTVDSSQGIHGYHMWLCEDEDIPLSVTIRRYVSPGVWTTVASGSGSADYSCHGHALNIYRVNSLPSFYNTCG